MTKTKWSLIILAIIDLILFIMHHNGYVFLFLKPTGYVIPLVINFIIITIVSFRSTLSNIWTVMILIISIPIILSHSFMVWLLDSSYTTIDSPYHGQSIVIEYRHATLGETTYFYNFYRTTLGLVGKHLADESVDMMVLHRDHPSGIDAEGALGLGNEEWITANVVRFYTWQGMMDIHVKPSHAAERERSEQENMDEVIEDFIQMAKNKQSGQTVTIYGNLLTIRYDKESEQEWIDVSNVEDNGAIPTQQCSRIVPNKSLGFYMLEECTHQWEYPLYPMN